MNELIVITLCLLWTYYFYKLNKKKLNENIESLNQEVFKLKETSEEDKQYINTQRLDFSNTVTQLKLSLKEELKILNEKEQNLKTEERKLQNQVLVLEKNLEEETENRKKILSQKKSSEVRLGHIAETLAPFLDHFDFDPETCTFMGKPIDYVSFGEEEITFIEIKSGNSQLNSRQRHIRDLVKNKCIAWKEIRIK